MIKRHELVNCLVGALAAYLLATVVPGGRTMPTVPLWFCTFALGVSFGFNMRYCKETEDLSMQSYTEQVFADLCLPVVIVYVVWAGMYVFNGVSLSILIQNQFTNFATIILGVMGLFSAIVTFLGFIYNDISQ